MKTLWNIPWLLLGLVALLVAVGIIFIESSTRGTHLEGLAGRQLKAVFVAVPVALVFAAVHPKSLAVQAYWWYAGIVIALVAVLFVGIEINQARRWFAGPMGFLIQPSELAKPIAVLAVARWLERRENRSELGTLLGLAMLIGVPFLLIRAEPDLGTAMILLPMAAAMAYGAGVRRAWFLGAVVVGALGANVVYHSSLLEDYQKERIRVFTYSIPARASEALELRREKRFAEAAAIEQEIREVKRSSGYQSHTAQTSIGTGGLLGKGLGQGPHNRLGYLPERHNDFVFAVIAEEMGLLGGGALLLLFLLCGAGILQVAATTRDCFGRTVCCGAAALLTVQAGCNIGMTLGLLPITGLPLPLISQGGSSMMSSLALIGMVVSVARVRDDHEPFRYAADGPPPDPFGVKASDALRKRLRLH